MSFDPISAIAAVNAANDAGPIAQAGRAADAPGVDFASWVTDQVRNANADILRADDSVRRLALGEVDNLHQVMVQLERAKLSFELVVQVRNKILDAYQDIMRMQV